MLPDKSKREPAQEPPGQVKKQPLLFMYPPDGDTKSINAGDMTVDFFSGEVSLPGADDERLNRRLEGAMHDSIAVISVEADQDINIQLGNSGHYLIEANSRRVIAHPCKRVQIRTTTTTNLRIIASTDKDAFPSLDGPAALVDSSGNLQVSVEDGDIDVVTEVITSNIVAKGGVQNVDGVFTKTGGGGVGYIDITPASGDVAHLLRGAFTVGAAAATPGAASVFFQNSDNDSNGRNLHVATVGASQNYSFPQLPQVGGDKNVGDFSDMKCRVIDDHIRIQLTSMSATETFEIHVVFWSESYSALTVTANGGTFA